MKDEIKEILDELKELDNNYIILKEKGASFKATELEKKAHILYNLITNPEQENERLKQWDNNKDSRNSRQRVANRKLEQRYNDYKSRIDKAVEYIDKVKILNEEYKDDWTFKVFVPNLENILTGGDEK